MDDTGLPYGLSHRVSSARTSSLATAAQVRGKAWTHPYHGLIRRTDPDPGQPMARIHDAVELGGAGSVLGGWACAYVSGVTAFDGFDRRLRERPVLVFTPNGQLRPRAGFEPSRMRLRANEIQDVGEIAMTSLARAMYDEMLRAPSVREALAVVEAGTSRVTRDARTSLGSVIALVQQHKKTRGIVAARAALELACERSASHGESRLRLEALGAGAGPFLVNAPVFDPAGVLVGIVDLLDQEAGLVLEYDGAHHCELERHSADNAREEDLENLNLAVVRATGVDLTNGAEFDRRIRRGRRRGLARDRRQDRWTTDPPAWWYGSRLAKRWGVPPWR